MLSGGQYICSVRNVFALSELPRSNSRSNPEILPPYECNTVEGYPIATHSLFHLRLFEGVRQWRYCIMLGWGPPHPVSFLGGGVPPHLVAFLVPPAVSPNDPPHTHHQAFPDRQMRHGGRAAGGRGRICRSGKAWWWVWGGSLGETAGGTRNATRWGGTPPPRNETGWGGDPTQA